MHFACFAWLVGCCLKACPAVASVVHAFYAIAAFVGTVASVRESSSAQAGVFASSVVCLRDRSWMGLLRSCEA